MTPEITSSQKAPDPSEVLKDYDIKEKDGELLSGIHLQVVDNTTGDVAAECTISPIEEEPTMYEGKIKSYREGQGLGLAIWQITEEELIKRNGTILRLIVDTSQNNWTTRHITDLLNYLQSKGTKTQLLRQEKTEKNQNMWLFRFTKTPNMI